MNLEEDDLIERFLKNELSDEEDQRFRERLASDAAFQEKVNLEQQLFETFNEEDWSYIENADNPDVSEYARLFGNEESKEIKEAIANSIATHKSGQAKTVKRPLWLYASAAAVLLVLSFYFLFSGSKTSDELYIAFLDKTELPSLVTRGDVASEQIKGQAYFENREFAEAESVFSDLIRQYNQNGAFYLYLSLSLTEQGEFDEALSTLDELITSDLLDGEKGYWYKSLVYLKASQPEEAERVLLIIVENRYFNHELAELLLKELH